MKSEIDRDDENDERDIKVRDQLYFETIGKDFERFMSEYDVSRRLDLIFKDLLKTKNIKKNAAVLEIGCGTGRITKILRTVFDNITVNDISEQLVNDTALKYNCNILVGDCLSLNVNDESFDLIVSSECIEHTTDPFGALAEIKRIVRKDGLIVVTTPNKVWYPVLWIAEKLRARKYRGIENWIFPYTAAQWLRKEGFQDIYFSGCHLWPWHIPLFNKMLPWFDKWANFLFPVMINFGFCARKSK
ncbi:methyltransferase domain-containing protein [Candidatus Omnitrophota bacterium]